MGIRAEGPSQPLPVVLTTGIQIRNGLGLKGRHIGFAYDAGTSNGSVPALRASPLCSRTRPGRQRMYRPFGSMAAL